MKNQRLLMLFGTLILASSLSFTSCNDDEQTLPLTGNWVDQDRNGGFNQYTLGLHSDSTFIYTINYSLYTGAGDDIVAGEIGYKGHYHTVSYALTLVADSMFKFESINHNWTAIDTVATPQTIFSDCLYKLTDNALTLTYNRYMEGEHISVITQKFTRYSPF
jgi:hypothetical protein